jgi:hypothetical protein
MVDLQAKGTCSRRTMMLVDGKHFLERVGQGSS